MKAASCPKISNQIQTTHMKAEQVVETVLEVLRNHTGNKEIQASSLDKVEVIMKLEEKFRRRPTSKTSSSTHSTIEEQGGNPSFEEMVAGLVKPGEDILRDLNHHKCVSLAIAMEQAIKASRSIDAAKKYAVYGKADSGIADEKFSITFDLRQELTPALAHKLHMAIGLCGEAGEILEAVLSEISSGKRDTANEIEESGDLEFYAEGYRQVCGFTRGTAIAANIAKLGKRYKGHHYTDEQAIARADKAQDIHESPRAFDEGRAYEAVSTADLDARDRIGM